MSLPLAPLILGVAGSAATVTTTTTVTVIEKSRTLLLAPKAFTVTASSGVGGVNLQYPDPKAVWAFTGGSGSVTIDLGADTLIDTVFMGYATLPIGASWTITYGTAAVPGLAAVLQAASTFWSAPDAFGSRVHGFFYKVDAPVTARYLTISITGAGISEVQIGTLCVGASLRFQWGIEWDNLHKVIDLGERTELISGGFGIRLGAKVRAKHYPFGDITDEELQALDRIEMDVGRTKPIVVVSDYARTAGLNERITYGVFDSLEDRGRKGVNFARWAMKVLEWR
jgi:hypothetical protein